VVYSTYLGGGSDDIGNGIAVDSTGNAYVTGYTQSTSFPAANPLQASRGGGYDAFVTKINAAGSTLAYSTQLGGSGGDFGYGIAVDASGNAYVTGDTNSANFPVTNPIQASNGGGILDAFVTKVNAAGSALAYSTYLGGSDWDQGNAIAVDGAGNAYVTGQTYSTNFPTANPLQASNAGTGSDAFVLSISELPLAGTGTSQTPPPSPVVSAVENGASFQAGGVTNSWVSILGTNLSPVTDNWSNSIVNGALPTSLDGVSVSMGGKPAYMYYITPGQLNVLTPEIGPGPVSVTVTTPSGASAAVTATVSLYGPAFFLWPSSQVVATHQDYSYAAQAGTFTGLTTVPAKPGEVIVLWATGFGPTTPPAPDGPVVPSTQSYATPAAPIVMIDNIPALVYGAALASGSVGLYQVAIQVPSTLANGNWPIQSTIGGFSSPAGTVLTVQQ
jgi:uncharacterized protein (TIGR03437 family)